MQTHTYILDNNKRSSRKTDLDRGLRAMQANSTDRSVLELLGAILGEIIPAASVHLLAANQPQARPNDLLVDEAEVGRRRSGGLGEGGGGKVGADSEGFSDEEAGGVVGGERGLGA